MKKVMEKIYEFITVSSSCGWAGETQYNIRHLIFSVAMLTTIICVVGTCLSPQTVNAASKPKWNVKLSGTVVDVDPIAKAGASGLFFEVGDPRLGGRCSFVWIWQDDLEGSWPSRGDHGTFYQMRIGKDDKYRWVETGGKKPVVKKLPVKESVKKPVVVKTIPTSISWQSVVVGIPPVNKTVLVRYKNGKTITTAYLNAKKEWKLETDRERISGGRKIETIKEWKEIPR